MRHRQNDAYNQDQYGAYRRPDPSQGGHDDPQGYQEETDEQPYEDEPAYNDQSAYGDQQPYDEQAPYDDQASYDGQAPYEEQVSYDGQPPYGGQPPYNDQQYYGGQPPYQQEPFYGEPPAEPELVSTSQAINLTCTLAALSGFFALFLYIADKRSEAVRRVCVQSIVLTGGFLGAALVLWIVGTILSIIPFLGVILMIVFWLLFCALAIVVIYLKVQMMLRAYQGYAYQLPIVGERLRKFE
jgi:uncharacterized membrane protein